MSAAITGLGVWVPEEIRSNDAWPASFVKATLEKPVRDLADFLPTEMDPFVASYIERANAESRDPFLGAVRRRVAPDSMPSFEAESYAAAAALEDAGVAPEDVDVLFSYSVVPDKVGPPSAPKVASLLGASKAGAFGVDAGCASTIVQLQLALGLIESGQAKHVLLCQSNLMTRIFPLSASVSPTIGDMATAVLVSASARPGVLKIVSHTLGDEWESICWKPRAGGTQRWYEGNGEWTMGSERPERAKALMVNSVRFGVETIQRVLREAGMNADDLSVIGATQARAWMPGCIAKGLGLPEEIAPSTFEEYAHLGPCACIVNLAHAREKGMLRPGALCALYSQGISFTKSAALIRWQPN